MNEQLVVKNFGPIKDATVDFKRVTVFIGPTGGGKSTLAKLAMMFRGGAIAIQNNVWNADEFYSKYKLTSFSSILSELDWRKSGKSIAQVSGDKNGVMNVDFFLENNGSMHEERLPINDFLQKIKEPNVDFIKKMYPELNDKEIVEFKTALVFLSKEAIIDSIVETIKSSEISYFPAERIFLSGIEYSWAGLIRDDIGLSRIFLEFANDFSTSRKDVPSLEIGFLNTEYLHLDGRDFVRIPNKEQPIMLTEAASGIQSVTPMLVLLEHLSRNTEQAQSFIIEEPELNLYPTAQQGLLNWLVEKCTKGENDLTMTTHSPYILSSCNLLLEAYKVFHQRPELADEVATVVPRESWINPDEFAAYYVADGTVKLITDVRTHLIGGNELDAVSGDILDKFRGLLRLKKQVA